MFDYWKGKKRPDHALKMQGKNNPMYGVKLTLEQRQKRSLAQIKRVQEGRNNRGDGSIGDTNKKIRRSFKYKLWREEVFRRDNWTCVFCSRRGIRLNADHIKPFAFFPELRLSVDNGRTLCEDCHRKTDSFSRHRPMMSLNS